MKIMARKTTTKVAGAPRKTNEDVYRPSRKTSVARFVLCDGATTSFAGRAWAEALASAFEKTTALKVGVCELFQDDPDFQPRMRDVYLQSLVQAAKSQYEARFDPSKLSFFKQEAFKRGSAATLLVLDQDPHRPEVLQITAVGDSCVFVVDAENHPVFSFPLSTPEAFSTSAYLVETKDEGLEALFAADTRNLYWKTARVDLSALGDVRIVCATDAVSQWIVANRENAEAITSLLDAVAGTPRDYFTFIEARRQDGSMGVDDSTVVVLEK